MNKVFDFLANNWAFLSPVLLEIVLRVVPTEKNVSIIDNVVKVIGLILKNRRKPSIDDETNASGPQNVNIIQVDRNKHVI